LVFWTYFPAQYGQCVVHFLLFKKRKYVDSLEIKYVDSLEMEKAGFEQKEVTESSEVVCLAFDQNG
jgi:hypothetical protein